MHDQLLGYLLHSLDETETRAIEAQLENDPRLRAELQVLRRAIEPFEYDIDETEAASDLAMRTIARVAEEMITLHGRAPGTDQTPVQDLLRELQRESTPIHAIYPSTISEVETRSPARRNIFAAFGLVIALFALILPGILVIREQANQLACREHLSQFHRAINGYADTFSNELPRIEDGQRGLHFVSTLQARGFLDDAQALICPSAPNRERNAMIESATPVNYAFTFGYRDDQRKLLPLKRTPENSRLPIVADAPVAVASRCTGTPVALNHRKGQNVLFMDGNVRFCSTANLGIPGDDNIYCNQEQQIRAGIHLFDIMLGRVDEMP